MNILRNRIRMRKDSPAHSVSLDWRKTILVAFQFFAFLHRLGQFLPRHLTERAAALPHNAAAPALRGRGSYGPEATIVRRGKRVSFERLVGAGQQGEPGEDTSMTCGASSL